MSGRTRRDLLAVAGTTLSVGLAGCMGLGDTGSTTDSPATDASDATTTRGPMEPDAGEDGDAASGTASTSTPAATPGTSTGGVTGVTAADFGDHASAAGIEGQPVLGDVAGAPTTVIAFEDPSCPTCATFERRTGARIREELVPAGQTAFVMRTIPVIYPWGETAVPALEATFARDAGAFWALLDYYFGTQGSFGTDNVRDRTRSFLQSATEVDVEAVLADVDSGAVDGAVATDLSAAEEAGVRQSGTPTIFMFRDGEFLTQASGPVSFDLVTRVLGV